MNRATSTDEFDFNQNQDLAEDQFSRSLGQPNYLKMPGTNRLGYVNALAAQPETLESSPYIGGNVLHDSIQTVYDIYDDTGSEVDQFKLQNDRNNRSYTTDIKL